MPTPQFIRRLFEWTPQSTSAITDPGLFPSIYEPDTLPIENANSFLPINRAITLVSTRVASISGAEIEMPRNAENLLSRIWNPKFYGLR